MSRKDLASDIWRSYDIMRRDDGTTGILQYMEQVSWMIFLKIFEDLENRFEANARLENKEYDRIIKNEFRWSHWTKKEAKENEIIIFVDQKLFPYLRNLRGIGLRDTISSIFNEIKGNQMKSAFNFKDVVQIINEIDFNDEQDSHTLSKVYEESLLKLGREGGIAGEFYTPRPIVQIMVKMVEPRIGESVFDPFCGSCGFIVESFKRMKQSKELDVRDYEILQTKTFFGQEKKPLAHLMGVMNCIVHGLISPNIKRKNTLEDNNRNVPASERHTIILTNPPFGGTENKQIQQNFVTQVQSTELLALQYVMKHLEINGRCGIVVPEGILFRTDLYAKVKEELLAEFNLHTVISLPVGVFANVSAHGQGPKTNLLFFDRTGPTKDVWYYELLPEAKKTYSRANPINHEDLKDCFEKWKKREISDKSWLVPAKAIIDKNYDMSAKNPHRKDDLQHRAPAELVADVLEKEKEIQEILEEIQERLA